MLLSTAPSGDEWVKCRGQILRFPRFENQWDFHLFFFLFFFNPNPKTSDDSKFPRLLGSQRLPALQMRDRDPFSFPFTEIHRIHSSAPVVISHILVTPKENLSVLVEDSFSSVFCLFVKVAFCDHIHCSHRCFQCDLLYPFSFEPFLISTYTVLVLLTFIFHSDLLLPFLHLLPVLTNDYNVFCKHI